MSTYLYGYSDDLIELDGDIYEEFPWDYGWTDVIFSNGVHAQITFDTEGQWSIRVLEHGSNVVLHYLTGTPEANERGSYTELLVVDDAEWAVVGKKVNKRGT